MTVISPELELGAVAPPIEAARGEVAPAVTAPAVTAPAGRPSFHEAYEQHFDFVWRGLRRLGVPPASIDDAVQDVFVVVHRRLGDFEGRSSLRSWIFGIAVRVARDHQRLARRKGGHEPLDAEIPDREPGPAERLDRLEAVRLLDRLLATLGEDKRTVFVLFEIEELTAPEIAEALGVNVHTVYSRLRAARADFDAALAAHEGGRR